MGKKIGVIGLGSIGLRHAKNLHAMGHQVLGYDPEPTRCAMLKDIGADYTINMDDILACEGIVIASPTEHHERHLALCEGRPVFVEKPICQALCKHGWVMMVGYNLRFHSSVIEAKRVLDSGVIGKPYWAHFIVSQFCERPAYLRDGVILNWSHEIDLALHLMGPAKVLGSSTRLTDGKDDVTDILLEHEGGGRSFVHLDYLGIPERRHFGIAGTAGHVSGNLTNPRFTAVRLGSDAETPHEINYGKDTFDENYVTEMRAFIDRIDGKTTIGANGEDGLRTLEICLKVREQAGLE